MYLVKLGEEISFQVDSVEKVIDKIFMLQFSRPRDDCVITVEHRTGMDRPVSIRFNSGGRLKHLYDSEFALYMDSATGFILRVLFDKLQGHGVGDYRKFITEMEARCSLKRLLFQEGKPSTVHYQAVSDKNQTYVAEDPITIANYAAAYMQATVGENSALRISRIDDGRSSLYPACVDLLLRNSATAMTMLSGYPDRTLFKRRSRPCDRLSLSVAENGCRVLKESVMNALIESREFLPVDRSNDQNTARGAEIRGEMTSFTNSQPLRYRESVDRSEDLSTTSDVEKARRFLTHMSDSVTGNPYFFEDGYPKREIRLEAAAALKVLERLEKK